MLLPANIPLVVPGKGYPEIVWKFLIIVGKVR